MGWYKFESVAEFDSWHESIKTELGYPFHSIDASGNPCEPLNTEYTSVEFINDEFKAWVDEENAQGLIPTNPPIYPKSHALT